MDGRRAVVLIDGMCVLCNRTARWIQRHDRRGVFRVVPAQSAEGERLLGGEGRSATGGAPDSVIVMDDRGVWRESDAAIAIGRGLGGVWRLSVVLKVLPRWVRDGAYRLVARHRYRIWGREDRCEIEWGPKASPRAEG